MANRRPPLFELLQKENESRQKADGAASRPGVLGGGSATANGAGKAAKPAAGSQARGAVESKPASTSEGSSSRGTTLDDLSEAGRTEQDARTTSKTAVQASPALSTAVSRTASKPASRPAAEPKPSRPSPAANAGAADWSGMHPKRSVSVRLVWVYGAVAAMLAVVVAVWAVGYSLGVRSEEAKFEQYLRQSDQSTLIRDPIAAESSTSPVEPATRPAAGDAASERVAALPEAPARTRPAEPAIRPEPRPAAPVAIDVFEDVREPGNNYLKLASGMSMERAKGLAEHLSDNGVHAMALDEGRQGFGLYTAFPVPSGQYRTLAPQRRAHEARVVDLLRTVPADVGGPYTPRDQLWMRYDG